MSGAPSPASSTVRLADALTALSLATDAGNGFPLEKSLRTGVIATRLRALAGLGHATLADVLRRPGPVAGVHRLRARDGRAAQRRRRRLPQPLRAPRPRPPGGGPARRSARHRRMGRPGRARPLGGALPDRRAPRGAGGGTLGVRGERVGGRAPGARARRGGRARCDRSVVVADELISSFTRRRIARRAEHCLGHAAALDVIRVAGTFAARHVGRAASSEPLVASPAL